MDAWRAMEEIRHADAAPAERRRAPQARTAKEIDSSARLSQMSAQLLREDRVEPLGASDGCRAVVLARGIERSSRREAWCTHIMNLPLQLPGVRPRLPSLARPSERVAASGAGLRSRAGRSGTIRKGALAGLPSARSTGWRFRAATRGRAFASESAATGVRAAGRAGTRAAGGFGWIRRARTAESVTMRWTSTIANYWGT